MNFNRVATLAVALTTCWYGCETVERARSVQNEDIKVPGEFTVTPETAGLISGRDYSLTELEQIALEYHPSICQARQDLESARLQLNMTRSSRLPQISASGGYTRSTANNAAVHPYSGTTSGSWSGSLGLDLLVYDFGKLDARDRQCVEQIIAAEEQLRATQIEVVYALRTAFFERLRRQQLLAVALENAHQYRVHLEEAESMLEVGTRMQYDVTKAKVDWGNACLDVITASNNVKTAQGDLNLSLGLAESPLYGLTESELPRPLVEHDADMLMVIARENSPSLAVLKARERSALSAVDEMIAELFPDLNFGFSFDLSGRGFPLVWNFSGALRAAENLFDGKRNMAQIDQTVTDLRNARSRVAAAEQNLYSDLVKAVAQRDSARESSAIAKMVYDQAKENLAIVEEQYRVGTASSVERTDAQTSVTQAHAKVVTAYYDELDAQAKIDYLIGIVTSAQLKE